MVLAALICLLATYAAPSVIRRAQATVGRTRLSWLTAAGAAAGGGIWATHFVAMLAYQPRMPIGYDLGLTLLSIVVAIVITAFGFAVAITSNGRSAAGSAAGSSHGHPRHALHRYGSDQDAGSGRLRSGPDPAHRRRRHPRRLASAQAMRDAAASPPAPSARLVLAQAR